MKVTFGPERALKPFTFFGTGFTDSGMQTTDWPTLQIDVLSERGRKLGRIRISDMSRDTFFTKKARATRGWDWAFWDRRHFVAMWSGQASRRAPAIAAAKRYAREYFKKPRRR